MSNAWIDTLETFKNEKELYAAIRDRKQQPELVMPADCELRPYEWKGNEPFPQIQSAQEVQARINLRKAGNAQASDQQVEQGRMGAMQRLNMGWAQVVHTSNEAKKNG